ncbi:hypothetical protein [Arvimicrobium flavum]|uniref:hypothetical protein n=1 Tax=Arvimicrobium flavum TaxID=3393320 RepID=UPI00237A6E2E|nr:hypothetical protein [Mesorhizobium shangrilense]
MGIAVGTTGHAGKPPKASHLKKGLPAKAKASLKTKLVKPDTEVSEGEVIIGFDYNSILEPKLRQMAQEAAKRIAENNRTIESKVLDTGRTLIAFKEAIKSKGRLFGDWIEAACPFSYKTALNYMAVAREFGDDYHLLTYIPSQMLYPLASGKGLDDARSAVLEAAKDGNPLPVSEVEKLISQPKAPIGDGDEDPASIDKAEIRRTAAAKAMSILQEDIGDFTGFMALVREAGREFTIMLNNTVKGAA